MRAIGTEEEFKTLVKRQCYTVIDFTATWCGPCKRIAPVFEELQEEHEVEGSVEFFKLDVDDNNDAAAAANVTRMPTFQVWNNNLPVYTVEGANEAHLRRLIELTKERAAGLRTDESF